MTARLAPVVGIWLLLAAPVDLRAGNHTAEAQDLRAELASEPAQPLRNAETAYRLRLRDASGNPVNGAKVTLSGQMADGMAVITPLRPAGESGTYSGRVIFTMEGEWQLKARVVWMDKPFELLLTERVGR
jgi:hypothetical protein